MKGHTTMARRTKDTGIIHESKNGRWVISRGQYDVIATGMKHWTVRDTFQNTRVKITLDGISPVEGFFDIPGYICDVIMRDAATIISLIERDEVAEEN